MRSCVKAIVPSLSLSKVLVGTRSHFELLRRDETSVKVFTLPQGSGGAVSAIQVMYRVTRHIRLASIPELCVQGCVNSLRNTAAFCRTGQMKRTMERGWLRSIEIERERERERAWHFPPSFSKASLHCTILFIQLFLEMFRKYFSDLRFVAGSSPGRGEIRKIFKFAEPSRGTTG